MKTPEDGMAEDSSAGHQQPPDGHDVPEAPNIDARDNFDEDFQAFRGEWLEEKQLFAAGKIPSRPLQRLLELMSRKPTTGPGDQDDTSWRESLKELEDEDVADYVVGAIVLAQSIRDKCPKAASGEIALVCLHTEDIRAENVQKLVEQAGWECRCVKDIHNVAPELFNWDRDKEARPHRFDRVFTKLRVFEVCVDFHSVLMLDIDTLCLRNLDHVFEDLAAPAAIVNSSQEYQHGVKWDSSQLLSGGYGLEDWQKQNLRAYVDEPKQKNDNDSSERKVWLQHKNINAGVMLLRPSVETFDCIIAKITERHDPFHIPASAPEQAFLTRFFAGEWRAMHVTWNFQLHRLPQDLDHWAYLLLQQERDEEVRNPDAQPYSSQRIEVLEKIYPCPQPAARTSSSSSGVHAASSEQTTATNGNPNKSLELADVIQVIHFSGAKKPWNMLTERKIEADGSSNLADIVEKTYEDEIGNKRDFQRLRRRSNIESASANPESELHRVLHSARAARSVFKDAHRLWFEVYDKCALSTRVSLEDAALQDALNDTAALPLVAAAFDLHGEDDAASSSEAEDQNDEVDTAREVITLTTNEDHQIVETSEDSWKTFRWERGSLAAEPQGEDLGAGNGRSGKRKQHRRAVEWELCCRSRTVKVDEVTLYVAGGRIALSLTTPKVACDLFAGNSGAFSVCLAILQPGQATAENSLAILGKEKVEMTCDAVVGDEVSGPVFATLNKNIPCGDEREYVASVFAFKDAEAVHDFRAKHKFSKRSQSGIVAVAIEKSAGPTDVAAFLDLVDEVAPCEDQYQNLKEQAGSGFNVVSIYVKNFLDEWDTYNQKYFCQEARHISFERSHGPVHSSKKVEVQKR
eukprot:g8512.t1